MKIDFDKDDFMYLFCGTNPTAEQMESDEQIKSLGRYSETFNMWIWNLQELKALDEKVLYQLYQSIKMARDEK